MNPLIRFVQPDIRRYRIPFFQELARRSRWPVECWADLHPTMACGTGAVSRVEGIGCVHAPERTIGPFIWQPGAWRAAGGDAGIVVFSWNSRYLLLGPALLRARRNGLKTVLWGHGVGKNETPLRRRVRNALLRLADAAVLYSQGGRSLLVDEGLDPSRIFVAPNAVDQEPVRQARAAWGDADLERFRRENRLEGRETISFLSRLDPSKRVDQLLEAFSVVVQARPNACLVLIGDGPERDRLQRMAKRLPPDSVRFVGALFTEAEIAPWLLSSRCFAYPRAIGLSIYHAFGFGLPVITCRPPGGHGPEIESLVDGVNGLLFAEGDVQGLAASLVAILGDEPLRRRLSAGAEATVHGEGGWDIPAMVSGFLHCFERVAGNSRQRQDGA